MELFQKVRQRTSDEPTPRTPLAELETRPTTCALPIQTLIAESKEHAIQRSLKEARKEVNQRSRILAAELASISSTLNDTLKSCPSMRFFKISVPPSISLVNIKISKIYEQLERSTPESRRGIVLSNLLPLLIKLDKGRDTFKSLGSSRAERAYTDWCQVRRAYDDGSLFQEFSIRDANVIFKNTGYIVSRCREISDRWAQMVRATADELPKIAAGLRLFANEFPNHTSNVLLRMANKLDRSARQIGEDPSVTDLTGNIGATQVGKINLLSFKLRYLSKELPKALSSLDTFKKEAIDQCESKLRANYQEPRFQFEATRLALESGDATSLIRSYLELSSEISGLGIDDGYEVQRGARTSFGIYY